MKSHMFYDLGHELEQLDPLLFFELFSSGNAFSNASVYPSSDPSSITPPILFQLPPPARCSNKIIQVLPVITEVSEDSPNLFCTLLYDAGSNVSAFRPLAGARVSVVMDY